MQKNGSMIALLPYAIKNSIWISKLSLVSILIHAQIKVMPYFNPFLINLKKNLLLSRIQWGKMKTQEEVINELKVLTIFCICFLLVGFAKNMAIQQSSGEYLCFMDAVK